MAYTFDQLNENIYRISNDHETPIQVLGRLLSKPAKTALMAQLETAIDDALAAEVVEYEAAIRDIADRLPVDNLLRLAIEAV